MYRAVHPIFCRSGSFHIGALHGAHGMLGITLEQAFFVFGRLCLPARAARGKNGVDLAGRFFLALHADDRQHAAGNIDADQIALFHQRDRARRQQPRG